MNEVINKSEAMKDLDPIASFINLKKNFPEAFFFQSHDLEGKLNLSIIGLDRFETLTFVGNQTVIETVVESRDENKIERKVIEGNFLQNLSLKLKSYHNCKSQIPYSLGGAFGCIGYEMVAQMEKSLQKNGFFKTSIDHNEVEAEIYFSKNLIVFEHKKKLIHFNLSNITVSTIDLSLEKNVPLVEKNVTQVKFDQYLPTMGKKQFLQSVAILKEHIAAGNIFQAVLSERFERPCHLPALNLFQEAKRHCPSAYSFYFDFKASSFFGFSPEVFLKIEKGVLETHPIAGTMPRGATTILDNQNAEILNQSVKEGAEHLMLVDLARNDLGRVAIPGSVKVTEFRKLLKLSNVMHLVSVVKAKQSPEQDNVAAFTSCFPAGTLSGAPKIRAMEILSELESRPRGFYGGAIVAFDHTGDLDSCIAIRSVEVKEGKVILRAGAGIVADSIAENEYLEIEHKLKALVQVIDKAHQQNEKENFQVAL
ncbi:MAG: anthranilate synthase component I family protein [Bacteriovoracaceae bacterium]